MPIDSFIFSPSKYFQDGTIQALYDEFGLAGQFSLLMLWGHIIRQDRWWEFGTELPTRAIYKPLKMTKQKCENMLNRIEEYRPNSIYKISENKIFFYYPSLYKFLGRYGQVLACKEWGFIPANATKPLEYKDFIEQEDFKIFYKNLNRFKIPPRDQIRVEEKRSTPLGDTNKALSKKSSGGLSTPPRLHDIFDWAILYWSTVMQRKGDKHLVRSKQRAFLDMEEKIGGEELMAQIKALGDPDNWWHGKIKKPETFLAKLDEGIDFVARLKESQNKKPGKLATGDEYAADAEKLATKGLEIP